MSKLRQRQQITKSIVLPTKNIETHSCSRHAAEEQTFCTALIGNGRVDISENHSRRLLAFEAAYAFHEQLPVREYLIPKYVVLAAKASDWVRPAQDNRRFLNGMLYVLRVGCPWRDMWQLISNHPIIYDRRDKLLPGRKARRCPRLQSLTLRDWPGL